MNELEDACRDGGTVFELAERLLQICRRGTADIATFHDDRAREKQFAHACLEAEGTVNEVTSTAPDRVLRSDAHTLIAGLKKAAAALGSVAAAARAYATALERQRGVHFLDAVLPEGTCRAFHAGTAIPLVQSPIRKALNEAQLSVREQNRGPWIERLHCAALLPAQVYGFQIVIRRLPRGSLDDLADNFCVGFGALHEDLVADYEWDTEEERFFRVRPKSNQRQVAAFDRLLMGAETARAQVLVLPELCHGPDAGGDLAEEQDVDTWKKVIKWFQCRGHARPKVLVAGSRHIERRGPTVVDRRNELLILVDGCKPHVHNKFNPLTFPAGKLSTDAQREDIRTDRSLTLYMGSHWSFVPLICKDFLLPDTLELLRALHPALVLIASMSEKTMDFENDAKGLTSACQSVVVYANTPLVLEDERGNKPGAVCLGFVTRPLTETRGVSGKGLPLERHEVPVPPGDKPNVWQQTPCLALVTGSSTLKVETFQLDSV